MKRTLRFLLVAGAVGAVVLGFGNRSDLWLWAYLAVFTGVGLYAMSQIDDDLARERFSPPDPGADRLSLRWVRLIALAHVIAGVLDSRHGWTHVAAPLRAVGIIGFAACFLLIVRAMQANRFFSAVVRVQTERGHRVIDSGPYRVVRHPGYAAMLPLAQFSALALGSWIALAFAFAYSVLIFRRVLFEDGFLRENLAGYAAYASRVRYRLVPGLW